MTKTNYLLLFLAIIFGLLVRLYQINGPIADWHSFRQADTASVTRHFIQQGIALFRPTYHDYSNVQSGFDNPQGYRFVEFPIYNAISALSYRIFQPFNFTPEVSSRLVSILFNLGSAIILFLICFQLTHLFAPSFWSFAVFLFLPFNIYYSRTILPEPPAVFFMLLSLWLFNQHRAFSFFALAISILIKPYTILIIAPTFLFLFATQFLKTKSIKSLLISGLYLLLSVLPLLWWRYWMKQYPEGIPVNQWLLAKNLSYSGLDWFRGFQVSKVFSLIIFHPYWYRWLFYERIANLILGSFGLIPLFLGLLYRKNRTQLYCLSLIIGIILYFVIVAGGNIQHDYYQVLIIPSLSIILGFGFYYLSKFSFTNRLATISSLVIIIGFSLLFSGTQVLNYYKINNPNIITAGHQVNTLLPQNALVIAPYNGDTAFLYQTNRNGWPTEIYDIPKLKSQHPHNPLYLVSVNYDQYTNSFLSQYPTIIKNDQFVIIDLNQPLKNEKL